ncbi:FliC/FljB family flagellin [Morganella morganii]|uniref:FliC/FljB family flagellin n=1 Tax=Morganella morganii TaxID=582 RepID=UPI000291A3F9|nr:FliC/FljB family flagellin [Morganella morganii]HDS6886921.1 FliC/FljB family flagellin [Morganella morganii subsp. morganii]AVK37706.1 flagellin 1 [Morganella morganii]ELO7537374.1 FliC/FljB family flagellin [Morganella morganii]EMP52471.1 Flagellar biosynthesis protein FliC [Morganella morganii SC01]MBM7212450.1 FliC/FljB family flagellin [Morganella morganii]
MAQVINTNVLSLVTQNNLNRSQGVLGSAIERLSSGSRINSAKDDAAGQAIANRFTANVKGLTQASRNANDGISIAQTAEGAVNEINDNLQRIRELTVQAKNGTNSSSDIASIQAEVKDRMDEITRISDQTQFNGIKVLASDNEMSFQVGANDGEVINLKMDKINLESLNIKDFKVPVPQKDTVLKSTTPLDATALLAEAAKSDATFTKAPDLDGHTLLETESGSVVAKNAAGDYFEVKGFEKKGATGDDAITGKLVVGDKIEGRVDTKANLDAAGPAVDTDKSLKTLDDALTKVDTYRSKLGAFQNRMQSTINNLNNSVNNLSAARSRIQDADFATEVSNMSRGQILQQAGTAVLAQANQVPQGVLSLLR